MPTKRRTSFTDLPPNSSKELVSLQDSLIKDLSDLRQETIGLTTDTKVGPYAARYNESIRVLPPAAGTTMTFPPANSTTQNKWIEIMKLGGGALVIRPTSLLIDGAAFVTLTTAGLYSYRSDGGTGWWKAATAAAGGSTPTGTGFRHVTAGVEDAASKLVDTADVNLLQITGALIANTTITAGKIVLNTITHAQEAQPAVNTIAGNWTAALANMADNAVAVDSIVARFGGNIAAQAAAAQSTFIKAAGNMFNATAAAGQSLRRSIAGGDLGFSAAEERALGVPITANAAAAALTTVLSCTGSQNIPANSTIVGSTFLLRGWFSFLHTAATTPTITAQVAVNGATVASAILTPIATAGTFSGAVDGTLSIRTTGAGGTAMPQVHFDQNFGGVGTVDGSVLTAPVGFDTTIVRSLELRIFMTTAVAGNTLTVTNGYIQRIS